jgi:hypothetical protein
MLIISTHNDATQHPHHRFSKHRQPPKLWKTSDAHMDLNDTKNTACITVTHPPLRASRLFCVDAKPSVFNEKRHFVDRRQQQIPVSIDQRRQQRRRRRLSKAEKIIQQLQPNATPPTTGRWINEIV